MGIALPGSSPGFRHCRRKWLYVHVYLCITPFRTASGLCKLTAIAPINLLTYFGFDSFLIFIIIIIIMILVEPNYSIKYPKLNYAPPFVKKRLGQRNLTYFYFPYLHKGSIGIEKKSPSEIFSEFHVSDNVDSEK